MVWIEKSKNYLLSFDWKKIALKILSALAIAYVLYEIFYTGYRVSLPLYSFLFVTTLFWRTSLKIGYTLLKFFGLWFIFALLLGDNRRR